MAPRAGRVERRRRRAPRATQRAGARAVPATSCELLNLPIDTAVTALASVLKFYKRRDAIERAREDEAREARARRRPSWSCRRAMYLACKLEESVVSAGGRRGGDGGDARRRGRDGDAGRTRGRAAERGGREGTRAEGEALAGYAVVGRGAGDEGAEAMNAARDGDAIERRRRGRCITRTRIGS